MNQPFDPNQQNENKQNEEWQNQQPNQSNSPVDNQSNNQSNNQVNSQSNNDFDLQSEFDNQTNYQASSQGNFQGNEPQNNQGSPINQDSINPSGQQNPFSNQGQNQFPNQSSNNQQNNQQPFNQQNNQQYHNPQAYQNQNQHQNQNHQAHQNQQQNPYATPNAQITPPPLFTDNQFYVVSKKKFLILMVATFGIYQVYWFWKHWTLWKVENDADIWAIPRALFAIFFTHKLFSHINEEAERRSGEHLPDLAMPATIYVISCIINYIVNKMTETTPIILDLFIIVGFLAVDFWILWKAQEQANIACDDPDGDSNDDLTVVNYVFVVLGAILWVLFFLGIVSDLAGFV